MKELSAEQEAAIKEKMAAGLSRTDAVNVLRDQALDDDIRAERELLEARARKEAGKKPEKTAPNI